MDHAAGEKGCFSAVREFVIARYCPVKFFFIHEEMNVLSHFVGNIYNGITGYLTYGIGLIRQK